MLSVPLVVNEEFKARRPSYVRRALAATILLHALLLFLAPAAELRPYKAPESQPIVTLQDVEEYNYSFSEPDEVSPPDDPVKHVPDPDPVSEPPATSERDIRLSDPQLKRPSNRTPFVAIDELPKMVLSVRPEYPPLAREAGIEGTVRLVVLVGADGKVISAHVLSSDVTPSMEKAAVRAAMKCKFKPGRQRHTPVKATVVIPFHFKLR